MPEFARAASLEDLSGGVVLCANHRLARALRGRHDAAQRAAGRTTWPPLAALTPDQWLDSITETALLAGAIPAAEAPRLALSAIQERVLWEAAIAATAEAEGDVLFDREGLAAVAVEANAICETWGLRPGQGSGEAGEETQQFLRWRAAVRRECRSHGWLEAARQRAWQIGHLAAALAWRGGQGRVAFAGFDRYTPQETELARVLAVAGIEVMELALGRPEPGRAAVVGLPDRRGECRAVAAWAARRLVENPEARLGIVAPDLGGVRETLAAALDDALHPEALLPGQGESPRRYNFSLGLPLARAPIVATALELLALCAHPQRCDQSALGTLLLGPYWSAWQSEADGRARLDAAMRRCLPPMAGAARLLDLAGRLGNAGAHLPRTRAQLEAVLKAADAGGGRRLPSAWSAFLDALLAKGGWPGERSLSSHEWQAREAFRETLDSLGGFDAMLGKIKLAEACRQVARLCRERVFQPETEGSPAIEVMGPLEAAGLEFDALWVLGMNDDVWPPPPRPNPLLPAEMQRRAGSANASAEIQAAFARSVHRRLLRAAPEIVFSWAEREGDRALRASPLLAGLPAGEAAPATFVSAIEAQVGRGRLEAVDDHRGPPVAEGETVAGGAGLLKAQALCPAWAFYRYRLGARPLEEPVEGLDPSARGTLLHRVMERFFAGRNQQSLLAMGDAGRREAIRAAVSAALADLGEERGLPLPPRFAALEQGRLEDLLGQWLELELARPVPFAVAACEVPAEVEIEGLALAFKVDRVDELPDGSRLVIDYKTGGDLKPSAWGGERIAEPQLPVYAAWVGASPAGVAFAQVRTEDCAFIGLAAQDGLLPGCKAAPDWPATIMQWRAAIAAIAREIRDGEASVSFADEADLRHCDVQPLLRLPEVRMQRESS